MLIEVDFGQLPFDTFATGQPTGHSALTRYNDREKSGQPFPLGRLSSQELLILAQTPQYI